MHATVQHSRSAPFAEDLEDQLDAVGERRARIALFVDRLTQGGVQHSFLGLAKAFVERGFAVDLVVGDQRHRQDYDLPADLRLVFLHAGTLAQYAFNELRGRSRAAISDDWRLAGSLPLRWRSYLPGLTDYLTEHQPDALLSAKTLGNLVAILARRRAAVPTRLVISERGHVSESAKRSGKRWKRERLPHVMRELYPLADDVVAISGQVADDLAEVARLERQRIVMIHNALLRESGAAAPRADHPWFQGKSPVILGAGRLSKQKDFPTLIRAFTRVRAKRPARLIIIGEGEDRERLQILIGSLGVSEDVLMPGFQTDPSAYMKAADLFVLSSTHEGFGNVILEALAVGCPVVSTDCPAGPSEILDGGRFGTLTPVDDPKAMASAIETALDSPASKDALQSRAREFSMDQVAERYLACLLPGCINTPSKP